MWGLMVRSKYHKKRKEILEAYVNLPRFSAAGSMVWKRSPNALCRMGTLGTRTSDL